MHNKNAPLILSLVMVGSLFLTGCIMLLASGGPQETGLGPVAWIPIEDIQPTAETATGVSTPNAASGDLTSDGGLYGSHWSIGQSLDGRDIEVYRWGSGDWGLALIGGIHGDYERNTVELNQALVQYFMSNPTLPSNISLYIIPMMNPDGYYRQSRLNARGVDLNRNWDCAWSAHATYRGEPLDPGHEPFSEPETAALSDFVSNEGIDAVIMYHSAHGSVAVGVCSDRTDLARSLGAQVKDATGYDKFYQGGMFYPMTGDATGYFNSIGLAAIEIELTNHTDMEFDRNLNGVRAAIEWLSARN
jgi:hypothetical protein